MNTVLPHRPSLVLAPAPVPVPNRTQNPLFRRTHYFGFAPLPKPGLRGSLAVAKLGFKPEFFPDPDSAEGFVRELFGRAEGLLYTVADAAVSSSSVSTSDTVTTAKQSGDWFTGITNYMETVLKVLNDGLSALHVPYAYGFAIILLTVLVKAATFPLTKKQVESAMSMRALQPQVKAIQQRYAADKERVQLETARLYKVAGINPLAGCLPTLATIPVWIGLYRALSNVADEGLLTEGFFWIPSLSGPTTIAARQSGSGVSWLFPFVDGHPPLGWSDTLAYLVLPVLLVASQYISIQIMQSTQPQSNDPNMKTSQAITKFLPLMIGYFSLSVPSGLSLYWLTNNILSTAQQVWLQKLGGAKIPVMQFPTDVVKEDQPQVKKSISDLNVIQNDTAQEKKLTAKGPQPGERFKKLKEEEARRKRQREEEKRKAEAAAAAKETQIANEKENEAGVDLFVKNNEAHSSENTNHNSSNGVAVNGDLSKHELKGSEETTPTFQVADNAVSTSSAVERRDTSQSHEDLGKKVVEVYTTSATKDNKFSEEDTLEARKD
ncbi:ALBINO3-like protein 1, chloroplastic [Humulus lupulus]|uniref:ALBINO3-like protein 1, chloroplastic n=1 Tax=Humulus lupulus TaxID=3486 RepID=UPI002B40D310|nr:ALBINO3-like protein 1, chloroplastic [Humulus lupulus]